MAVAGKPIHKKIFFADFNDIEYFNKKIVGNFIIFDKELAIVQSNIEIPGNKSLGSFIKNTIIQKELTKTLKDKKITVIIYILHGSTAWSIMDSINKFIVPLINKNIKFTFYSLPADIKNETITM